MDSFAPDFTRIQYLSNGNERQREVYGLLRKTQVMDILQQYDPILTGTVPIEIDLPGSDLDIICQVHDFKRFEEMILRSFRDFQEFGCSAKTVNGIRRMVAHFKYDGWPIEIFGQPIPTTKQNGYRHMVAEHRVLGILGQQGRESILSLKAGGLKTEPAFARLMKLEGNPYQRLLEVYDWEPERLTEYLKGISIHL